MSPELEQLKRENARLKELQKEGVEIAKAFKKETGMVWGDRIGEYLSACEGSYHNSKEYNYERLPGEQ